MTKKLYPSRRPKVADVNEWYPLIDKFVSASWRQPDGPDRHIKVERGYPFPDFYRVIIRDVGGGNKKSKLFYGEMAHYDVIRWASDNYIDIYYEML
jgi:hypothetical protein